MTATERIHPRDSGAAHRVAPLLDLDPDLGQFLTGEAREAARRQLHVSVRRLAPGAWDTVALTVADPGHVGLLLIDGVMAREVVAGGQRLAPSCSGPGDIVRPWQARRPVAAAARRRPLERAGARRALAVLDRRFGVAARRYPEINAVLVDRLSERAQRLAVTQAISQLNRRRPAAARAVLAPGRALGPHAARGVAVPLALSHRMIAQLSARAGRRCRPRSASWPERGELVRRGDGTWLLTGEPVGEPARQAAGSSRRAAAACPRDRGRAVAGRIRSCATPGVRAPAAAPG